MVDVSVVIVSYNTAGLLRRCLASVGAEDCTEVFVVDNGSTDGSRELVAAEFPAVRLLANERNVGFSRGNNQALRLASGEFVLLLNPDAELAPGALRLMADYARRHWDVGVVGPRLLYPDGQVQSSRRRFPTRGVLFVESTVLQRWVPNLGWLRRYYVADRSADECQEVDWVVGACLLVRGEVVRQVGLFDERFFMYSEELDWCRRIRLAGWRVVYLPDAMVVHHEAKSSEQNLARRNIVFNDSKCRYAAKHFGWGWALALRAFIIMSFTYQLLEEAAKLAVGHKPALRRERLSMLRSVIAWHVLHLTTSAGVGSSFEGADTYYSPK